MIAGSTAVRENDTSEETDLHRVGPPQCLSCGHRQETATEPEQVRHLLPVPWEPSGGLEARFPTLAFRGRTQWC